MGKKCYSTRGKLHLKTLQLPDRLDTINSNLTQYYPTMTRLQAQNGYNCITIPQFWDRVAKNDLASLERSNIDQNGTIYHINGRVKNIRSSGKKIWFIDIIDQEQSLQVIIRTDKIFDLNDNNIDTSTKMGNLYDQLKFIRKNDYVQCVGYIGKSQSKIKMISLIATKLPIILSPNQLPLPSKLVDVAKINQNRVINYQLGGCNILRFRFELIRLIKKFFQDEINFMEVETPILCQRANGAIAGKFNTLTKRNKMLQLRISPELWLKQLVISGMDKVFEIGKVFRNENVDSTHNCEFTILESYQRYVSIENLIEMAENFLKYIILNYDSLLLKSGYKPSDEVYYKITKLKEQLVENNWKFKRVEFIPTLSKEMNFNLNNMDWNEKSNWTKLIRKHNGFINSNELKSMRTDQIINKLGEIYIERRYCNTMYPTLLMYQPSVISPLAKNRDIDKNNLNEKNNDNNDNNSNTLTNRFEMFINCNEYMNAYEEENCPNLQYDKFKLQQSNQDKIDTPNADQDNLNIDMDYIENMKFGMPPVGGFGLGIDRLVMFLSGVDRIEHVLPFGTIDDIT